MVHRHTLFIFWGIKFPVWWLELRKKKIYQNLYPVGSDIRVWCLLYDRVSQDAKRCHWKRDFVQLAFNDPLFFYVTEIVVVPFHVAIMLSKPLKIWMHGAHCSRSLNCHIPVNSIITRMSCALNIFDSLRQMTSISFLTFSFFLS